jgi:hypothetical protein
MGHDYSASILPSLPHLSEKLPYEHRGTPRPRHRRGHRLDHPLVIVLASAALMVSGVPSLPDPIAIHRSGGFGSPWMFVLMPTGITVFFCAVVFAGVRGSAADGPLSVNSKVLLVIGLVISTFLGIGMLKGQESQGGLADAVDAPGIVLPSLFGSRRGGARGRRVVHPAGVRLDRVDG